MLPKDGLTHITCLVVLFLEVVEPLRDETWLEEFGFAEWVIQSNSLALNSDTAFYFLLQSHANGTLPCSPATMPLAL